MTKGYSAYVIPLYGDIEYMRINSGEHFGTLDILGSVKFIGEDID